MHQELDDPHYWLRLLEPVGNVAENELLDYLKEDGRCQAGIRVPLAQRLIEMSNGEFEALVAQLEEAERISYPALLNKLHGRSERLAADDDDIL